MVVKKQVGKSFYLKHEESEFIVKELQYNKNYGYWDGKEEEICERIINKLLWGYEKNEINVEISFDLLGMSKKNLV